MAMNKEEKYLPFKTWAKKYKIRYNEKLFDTEIMYFCKIWKAHRYQYMATCKDKNFNDYEVLQQKLIDYEKRILDQKERDGLLSQKEYVEALNELTRKLY